MSRPCFSIITINYNNAAGLKQTFDSVRHQTCKDLDYVVIDGGSSDDSKTIMEQNKDLFGSYTSEKDKGIYDAQNKGISKAKGDYLVFLNSGDVFAAPDFLDQAKTFIAMHANRKLIYGDTLLKNSDGSLYHIKQPDALDLLFFYQKTINHQSCLIHHSLFNTYGLYDIRYRICADFDFLLKVFIGESRQFLHFSQTAVVYENNGFSANPNNYELVSGERKQILEKHLSRQQLSQLARQERAMHTWQANLKRALYANKISYTIIKFYVKLKERI